MKNNWIKILSVGMVCFALTLLVNVPTHANSLKNSVSFNVGTTITPDEVAPWM